MMIYCKLVRDKIPQIIESQGETVSYRVMEDEEFIQQLHTKLNEEVAEFHKEMNLEELSDILEVVYAFADTIGSREELQRQYEQKHQERGGYKERIFLISKE